MKHYQKLRCTPLFFLLILILAQVCLSARACHAEWQWIYSDDSCNIYADFASIKIWNKPEGECADIRLKTSLTEKGVKEILTGREINSLPVDGKWPQLGCIISRQLFLTAEPKFQMMSIQYLTTSMNIIQAVDYQYSASRWHTIQNSERSRKVYSAVLKIAGK